MYLKLYKMCRHDLKECQKIIGDHIQKAAAAAASSSSGDSPGNGSQQSVGPIQSPTPSPAGSEGSVCSKSSGYTSAGETGVNGRLAMGMANHGMGLANHCLTVPQSVMQKQHQYCNYLSQCHELWEMADVYAQRGHCEGDVCATRNDIIPCVA